MTGHMEFLYETHVHTAEISACAVSTAADQVLAYKEHGYTGIIVTDHFINGNSTCLAGLPWEAKMRSFVSGYENAKAAGKRYNLDVFFGWEYTINGLDFLTYGLDLDFLIEHPGIDRLPIEHYSELIRENGGYIAQAHPYRSAWYIAHGGPVDASLIDGVEVYNSADTRESNASALAFAEDNKLAIQAGSDSHSAHHSTHSRYSGIILDFRANDIYDIITAIKSMKVKIL